MRGAITEGAITEWGPITDTGGVLKLKFSMKRV